MAPPELNLRVAVIWFAGVIALSTVSAAEEKPSEVSVPKAADQAEQPNPEQIAGWIAQLDNDKYLAREAATRKLLGAGTIALDPLLETANGKRLEPADRAVWILRRLSQSRDNNEAIAALERLVQLTGRPLLVEKAELKLAERSVQACQERLAPLGAEVSLELEPIDIATVVPILQVRLGETWKGTTADLQSVAELRQQQHFRFIGAPVVDTVVKMFEERDKLAFLQLRDTKVTPAAIDALKLRHPNAMVLMRNEALLGISAETHAAGVIIRDVRAGTAAAEAGLVPGDVIETLDGHALPDFDRLTVFIAQHRAGDVIDVEIRRGDKRQKIAVTLGRWPDDQ